ncbi:hypothetical protein ABIE44_002142 [Marmoricola sp. OAE513]|uniref:hypothetical protein n=1 Tax=Marmoricola sp. OAE513 TaxID=2817894 RepID=UPI001AE175CA
MSDHQTEEDRQQEVLAAVLKFLGIALAIGLFIGLTTMFVVKSLDLNSTDDDPFSGPGSTGTIAPLPTTALTDPAATDEPTDLPTDEPSDLPTLPPEDGDLVLHISPATVGEMERVNLTGEYAGQDNVSLLVQRFEDGEWVDFGVQLQVNLGSFATYVQTSREGENKFRVYDPANDTTSNEVSVTVD